MLQEIQACFPRKGSAWQKGPDCRVQVWQPACARNCAPHLLDEGQVHALTSRPCFEGLFPHANHAAGQHSVGRASSVCRQRQCAVQGPCERAGLGRGRVRPSVFLLPPCDPYNSNCPILDHNIMLKYRHKRKKHRSTATHELWFCRRCTNCELERHGREAATCEGQARPKQQQM
jgi:hypothetical protein